MLVLRDPTGTRTQPQPRARSRGRRTPYNLSGRGAREVVLSGIDLGNYGRDLDPTNRARWRCSRLRSGRNVLIEQIRVSSIEPMDTTEDLIGVVCREQPPGAALPHADAVGLGPHCCRGDASVVSCVEHYARRVELVREWFPDAAIGADVIAGFPGETEEDHHATLSLIEAMPLTYLHVFSFSPRPGTAAAEMPDRVRGADVARRARELRALGEEKKSAFRGTQVGRMTRVLTLNRGGEDASGPWTRALAGNYLDVRVAGRRPANQFVDVRIAGVIDGHLVGIAV